MKSKRGSEPIRRDGMAPSSPGPVRPLLESGVLRLAFSIGSLRSLLSVTSGCEDLLVDRQTSDCRGGGAISPREKACDEGATLRGGERDGERKEVDLRDELLLPSVVSGRRRESLLLMSAGGNAASIASNLTVCRH